jgi:translocation and assembly module TamB
VRATELDYASWTLIAHGVELHDGARSLLQAGELRARPSFNALLRGHLELHSLELSAGAVHLNAADLQRLKRAALASPALIGALDVRVARLQLELTPDSTLQLTTALLLLSGHHFELHSAKAAVMRGGQLAADAQLSVSGQLDAAQGGGQIRLEQAHLSGQALAQPIALSWHSEGERVTCEGTLALGADAGAVAVALTLSGDPKAPFTLRGRLQALQLRRALALSPSAPPLPIDASIDGEFDLHGTLAPLALTGPLQLVAHALRLGRDPALLAVPQLKATCNARLDAGRLAFDALQISWPPSETLQGSAQLGRDAELTAELSAPELALAELGPVGGLALAGHGRVALRAKGPVQAPELHASLALSDAAIGGIALGKLNAELDITDAGRSLAIQHAEIVDSQRRLSSDGSLLHFAAGLAEARARIKVTHLPLTELYRLLGAGDDPMLRRLQGDTAGDVDLTYRRAETDHQLELELGLRLLDIELAGYRFDRGQLRARVAIPDGAHGLAGGVLTLEQMTLGAGEGTLELSGEMRRGALGMHVAMRALPLARDAWFHDHFASLTGRIAGQGELKSDAATARADIALSVEDLKLADAALGRVQLRALLRDRASAADSECSEGPAALKSGALGAANSSAWLICGKGLRDQLRVDLALGNGESRPVRGLFALDDFALSAFLPEASPGARVPGTLTAQFQVSGGGLDNLDHLSGQLRVEKLALGADDMALANSAPFELQLQAGEIALKGAALRGPKQKFVLRAAGALGHSARLIADGTVSASAFTHAGEPMVEAFGDVGMHLEWSPFSQTQTQPRLRGRVALNAVSVRVGAGTFLRNLGGELEVSDERVHVAAVSAELGGGQLQLDGQLALSGFAVANYALKLTAAHVALEPQPLIEVLLDADTHVDWSGGAALPRLTGDVRLKRALYGKQIQVNEAIAALSHQASAAAKKAPRDRLLVDLTLSHEQPLRIRNSLLDGEVMVMGPEHKLRIVGSDRQLGLAGQLAITRGRVLFYGDQFHVTHGEIAFTDPTRIAPQFDVSAVADRPKRPDTSIVFHAHGTREAFEVMVHCEAPGSGEPPPFTCKYARDHVHCDSFEQLVALWLCRTKPTLSQAESAH